MGKGEGGMFWENSIETSMLSRVKQIASPDWMHETVLRAGALGRPRGMGWRGRLEGESGWGTHVNPWLIYVNVWQKPLQKKKKKKEKKRKKAEHRRIDAFKLWYWRRLLRVPWTARRSNQPILKEISPEYWLEALMLKLKLQYFGHLMWRTDSLENLGNDWRWEEKRTTEDEMVGWHHRLSGLEFE